MSERAYTMTVAGQLFRHLGLQMYSGAVPAIAELISNAYDAMARNVWITIPTGRSLHEDDKVAVTDDGHGMTYDECNDHYLHVGRDRRGRQAGRTEPYNDLEPRRVQGRKGIGKLAAFGIADRIGVRTVKNREIAHFALDYSELTRSTDFADSAGYTPEPLQDDGQPTDEVPGTAIILSRLKITRRIDANEFKRSIARRLLVLDDSFRVYVNDSLVSRDEIPFQFRMPENAGSWETCRLPNGNSLKWWAGFCKNTISAEEMRGFVVYVRGKLAQTPWFFDLSGGVWGQHGMQYLTGEIRADYLDDHRDLIATDRGTVRWEDPMAAPLKAWGQSKVRDLLEEWTAKRRHAKITNPRVTIYIKRAKKLPPRERKIFEQVVNRICSIPQLGKDKEGKEITAELVDFAYNALTNHSFLEAIRRLNAAPADDIDKFSEIVSEWDIIEAVNTAHLVKGRVEIITKFQAMIDAKAKEKPDMQDYLKKYPWLIDPKWTVLTHETSLDQILAKQFDNTKQTKEAEGRKRPDYFCLGDRYQTAHVVEVKRPGSSVGRQGLDQLRDYVHFLRDRLQDSSTADAYRRRTVNGLLIADNVRSSDQQIATLYQSNGVFDIRTWRNLLDTTKALHAEYLEVVTKRAPQDDPRIKQIVQDGAHDAG